MPNPRSTIRPRMEAPSKRRYHFDCARYDASHTFLPRAAWLWLAFYGHRPQWPKWPKARASR